MQTLVIGIALVFSTLASATAATSVAIDQKEDIRVLGKLNINDASRDELLSVPGLDAQVVDEIVSERVKAPIGDLATLPLPPDAVQHLKIDGSSDFRRIRRLPLQVLESVVSPSTASR
jgi:hypothetical protein